MSVIVWDELQAGVYGILSDKIFIPDRAAAIPMYDGTPQDAIYPHVLFDDASTDDTGCKGFESGDTYLSLRVVSKEPYIGYYVINLIIRQITDLLRRFGCQISLTGAAIADVRFTAAYRSRGGTGEYIAVTEYQFVIDRT